MLTGIYADLERQREKTRQKRSSIPNLESEDREEEITENTEYPVDNPTLVTPRPSIEVSHSPRTSIETNLLDPPSATISRVASSPSLADKLVHNEPAEITEAGDANKIDKPELLRFTLSLRSARQ